MPQIGSIGSQLGGIGGGGGSFTLETFTNTLDAGGERVITGISPTGKIVIPILYSDPSSLGSLRVVSTTGSSASLRSDAGIEHAGATVKGIVIG